MHHRSIARRFGTETMLEIPVLVCCVALLFFHISEAILALWTMGDPFSARCTCLASITERPNPVCLFSISDHLALRIHAHTHCHRVHNAAARHIKHRKKCDQQATIPHVHDVTEGLACAERVGMVLVVMGQLIRLIAIVRRRGRL